MRIPPIPKAVTKDVMRLLFVPFFILLGMGSGLRGFAWRASVMMLALLLAACAWLLTPFALWQAFGFPWTLLWLLPTTAVVFGLGFAGRRVPTGGG